MDWCYAEDLNPNETYPLMSAALNKTGRPIHFNLCEWGRHDPKVWLWGSHVAQSWRCGGDHGPTWRSTSDIIHGRSQIPPELGGKPYAWNDMDVRRPSDPQELCSTRVWTAWLMDTVCPCIKMRRCWRQAISGRRLERGT